VNLKTLKSGGFMQEKSTIAEKTPKKESAETKRFDHHLIDQDLELEDKEGRRIDPKKELKEEKDSSRPEEAAARNSRPSE
jgi:hypothetical protein